MKFKICASIPLFLGGMLGLNGQESPVLEAEVSLKAEQGIEAYEQIRRVFGKNAIESPDLYSCNHPGFEHIQIADDPKVGAHFQFFLHRDLDGDRDNPRENEDRQRNEIKGYSGSSEGLKATLGQVSRYSWLFRVDEEMKLAPHFCHFFQLKAVGGPDASYPLLTVSGAMSDGEPALELRYSKGAAFPARKIRMADWSAVTGKWLRCDCVVRYHEEGFLRFSLSELNGDSVFQEEWPKVATWREGFEFVRPKWGIYRSLKNREAIANEEDVVSFADFKVQEWSELPENP